MLKFRLYCLLFCVFPAVLQVKAQSINTFNSDRPGMANTPVAVGKHYLQLQFGGSLGRNYGRSVGLSSYTSRDWNNDYFFRFGLNNKTELDFGFGLAKVQGFSSSYIYPPIYSEYIRFSHPTQLSGINIGLRHTFFTEAERDFSLGMLAMGNLTKGGKLGLTNEYGYLLSLLGAKQIGSRIAATANVGLQQNDSWTSPELFYVVNLAFDIGYNLGLFVEAKNEAILIDNTNITQWYNTGLYWKLTPNFMLDIHGGHNNAHADRFSERYWYGAFGLTWKIKAIAAKKQVTP